MPLSVGKNTLDPPMSRVYFRTYLCSGVADRADLGRTPQSVVQLDPEGLVRATRQQQSVRPLWTRPKSLP